MPLARKFEFSDLEGAGQLEHGRELIGGARQMRAGLVAVSENVADAELAESLVGSSDPYCAIDHRFVSGDFNDR